MKIFKHLRTATSRENERLPACRRQGPQGVDVVNADAATQDELCAGRKASASLASALYPQLAIVRVIDYLSFVR